MKDIVPTTYKGLMQLHSIRLLNTEVDRVIAMGVLRLMMTVETLNEDQLDYFNLLRDVIQKYERSVVSIKPVAGKEADDTNAITQTTTG